MDLELDIARLAIGSKAHGGEGAVYPLGDGAHVVKVYHRPHTVNFTHLRRLVAIRESLPRDIVDALDSFCAWPLCIVTENGAERGFAMNAVAPQYYMETSTDPTTPRPILRELQHLIVAGFLEGRDFYSPTVAEQIDIIGAFAFNMSVLHGLGLVIGDISMKNTLWTLAPYPSVFLLDVDAFTFEGQRPPEFFVETPGWKAPAKLRAPSIQSDRYKLALVAQRVLVKRHQSPLDPSEIAIEGEPELERSIRELVESARALHPADARLWTIACGTDDPGTLSERVVSGWIDQALMDANWNRAVRMGDLLQMDPPRLQIAREHLAAEQQHRP